MKEDINDSVFRLHRINGLYVKSTYYPLPQNDSGDYFLVVFALNSTDRNCDYDSLLSKENKRHYFQGYELIVPFILTHTIDAYNILIQGVFQISWLRIMS